MGKVELMRKGHCFAQWGVLGEWRGEVLTLSGAVCFQITFHSVPYHALSMFELDESTRGFVVYLRCLELSRGWLKNKGHSKIMKRFRVTADIRPHISLWTLLAYGNSMSEKARNGQVELMRKGIVFAQWWVLNRCDSVEGVYLPFDLLTRNSSQRRM
ncbi:hypothetical protein CEXT_345791 [Caerostris extrusa]|uniref:Uncharacterized protein n=1 Tax=Caerostris extrusa TaxID=172846 RepID=A0AAV4VRT5_CAEEX|nr:hypothetical protein CEXT_345791 [Caerostris extrusa]